MSKRKRTAPPKLYTERLQILVSKGQSKKLDEIARNTKRSMGAVLRALIDSAKNISVSA